MKVKFKITDEDPYQFKGNKFLKYFTLILGTLLFLLGVAGLITDWFSPSFSASYHSIAGPSNWGRTLMGALFLTAYYALRKYT